MQQGDLFGGSLGLSSKTSSPTRDFLSRYRLTLRLDHGMIGLIVLLCLCVFVFSLGVEKGKRYASDEIIAERQKRETVMGELRARMIAEQLKPQAASVSASAAPASEPTARKSEEASVADEAAAPAEEKTAAVLPAGHYTIQIVTYKTDSAALKQIQKYEEKGYKSFVIPSGDYKQVCLEAFDSKHQAVQTLKQLKVQGVVPSDAYVRVIPR